MLRRLSLQHLVVHFRMILHLVYPMPLETGGKDDIFVGRVRKDSSNENDLTFWLSGG